MEQNCLRMATITATAAKAVAHCFAPCAGSLRIAFAPGAKQCALQNLHPLSKPLISCGPQFSPRKILLHYIMPVATVMCPSLHHSPAKKPPAAHCGHVMNLNPLSSQPVVPRKAVFKTKRPDPSVLCLACDDSCLLIVRFDFFVLSMAVVTATPPSTLEILPTALATKYLQAPSRIDTFSCRLEVATGSAV